MRDALWLVLIALSTSSCKREVDSKAEPPAPVQSAPRDAAIPRVTAPTWYRAVLRSSDGVEAYFFVGVPPAGSAGEAIFRVGGYEVRSGATFDGTTLRVPLDIHQTAVEATVDKDGALRGTFTASWRAWGAASAPLTATKVASPATSALATVGPDGAAIELGEPRTVWRLAMSDSGVARLVVNQSAPGDFEGYLQLDTGNLIYLAGNGRGDTIVLTGFDGTSGFRVELALDADRKSARGTLVAGHRFDWREKLTAKRGADFVLAVKARAATPKATIKLPDLPELAALERGPLLVEIAGSWCTTCRAAAPFLVELYRTYQPRGLRMVTLLYEFTDDRAIDLEQAALFKSSYGVTWPIVPVTGSVEDFTEIMPSGLAGLNPAGFPISLFLDGDRSLVAIHAGFPPPHDKAEFEQAAAEFRAHIETLLANPTGSAGH